MHAWWGGDLETWWGGGEMGRSLACLGAVARWGGGVLGRLIQAHLGMDNGELARPEVLRARELAPLHHARVDMGPILKESAGSAADARGEVVPCEHKIARDRTGSRGIAQDRTGSHKIARDRTGSHKIARDRTGSHGIARGDRSAGDGLGPSVRTVLRLFGRELDRCAGGPPRVDLIESDRGCVGRSRPWQSGGRVGHRLRANREV